jgi:hypothetical protein
MISDGSRKSDKRSGVVVAALTGPSKFVQNSLYPNQSFRNYRAGVRLVLERRRITNGVQELVAVGIISSSLLVHINTY